MTDTVSGLFHVLFCGIPGEAYNLANETEKISILHLAWLLARLSGKEGLRVEHHIPTEIQKEYCNYKRVRLDTSKLERLGWKLHIGIEEGVRRTMESFRT